jgi:hypothetical protein
MVHGSLAPKVYTLVTYWVAVLYKISLIRFLGCSVCIEGFVRVLK